MTAPEAGAFDGMRVDYVGFYVTDLGEKARWFVDNLGFQIYGTTTQLGEARSVGVGRDQIRFLLTQAMVNDHPGAAYVEKHGDGVADIALQVADVEVAFATAVRRGARPISSPTTEAGVTVASIMGFGDVVHTFVSRSADVNVFALPGIQPVPGRPSGTDTRLHGVDHLAVCVNPDELDATVDFYRGVLDFTLIFDEKIVVGSQAIMTKVVQSRSGAVTLTLIAPDPSAAPGQIDQFLKDHGGPGVQHLAMTTDDIVAAVRATADRGITFLETPTTYYEALPGRITVDRYTVESLRQANILVDQDHDGQLFQIFARSVHPRNTFFVELIHRVGARSFGSGNISALYRAVQLQQQRDRSGESATGADAEPATGNSAADRLPLTLNQEFLCAFDKGTEEGAFSDRHTLTYGWRVRGVIDVESLHGALKDLVVRHDVLRTSLTHGEDGWRQTIHPTTDVRIDVRDLPGGTEDERAEQAERLVNELDAARQSVRELPLLRAVLGRFDESDSVLVLATHHIATDAWSMQILIGDLARLYASRRGQTGFALADMAPYRELAIWQQRSIESQVVRKGREYWREKLSGTEILPLSTDRPRRADVADSFAVYRFIFDPKLTGGTIQLASALRCSPFMVLMAAYAVLLNRRTTNVDVVVPTFTSGRYDERFLNTVGPFFNFLLLRIDLNGTRHFRDVVERTRRACLDAYAHDIPFPLVVAEAPNVVRPFADPNVSVFAFEMLQSDQEFDNELIGDLRYTAIRRRVLPQAVASGIPDGGLWAMDVLPSGEIAGSLKYNSNLFDEATAVALVQDLRQILQDLATEPERRLELAGLPGHDAGRTSP